MDHRETRKLLKDFDILMSIIKTIAVWWNNELTNSHLNNIWMKFQARSYHDFREFEVNQRATKKDTRNYIILRTMLCCSCTSLLFLNAFIVLRYVYTLVLEQYKSFQLCWYEFRPYEKLYQRIKRIQNISIEQRPCGLISWLFVKILAWLWTLNMTE